MAKNKAGFKNEGRFVPFYFHGCSVIADGQKRFGIAIDEGTLRTLQSSVDFLKRAMADADGDDAEDREAAGNWIPMLMRISSELKKTLESDPCKGPCEEGLKMMKGGKDDGETQAVEGTTHSAGQTMGL